jgi:hypothetical protein
VSATYDYAWTQARARVLRGATVCHLCGGALDWDAPARSPKSPSVDHIIPVKSMRGMAPEARRRLLLDENLLRPAHYGCNASRGAGRRRRNPHTSRVWR